jgi:hypothetical protein
MIGRSLHTVCMIASEVMDITRLMLLPQGAGVL